MSLITLHTTKYGETSLILHAYSLESGRKSFLLKGAYSSKTKKAQISSLHPLSIIDYQIAPNTKGSLSILKEFSPVKKLDDLRGNLSKSSMAMFIAELLYRSLNEESNDPKLYNFLYRAIILLNEYPGNCSNFHLWFCIRYSSELGFMPTGQFTNDFNPFTEEHLEVIKLLNKNSFLTCPEIKLKGTFRKDFLNSMIRYLEFHLSKQIKINSLDILHLVLSV